MALFALALLIGVIAGLRTFTAPAAVSWGAVLGILPLHATPLAFLAHSVTAAIFTLLALVELYADQSPNMKSRKSTPAFAARLISGALCGAAIGATSNALIGGIFAGLIGAAIGTLGGYEARLRMAKRFNRDLPAAWIEDCVAVAGAVLIVLGAR